MSKKTEDVDYQALSDELTTILSELESGDGDVDKAIELYQRGNEIVTKLEQYLKTAQNKVKKVKAST